MGYSRSSLWISRNAPGYVRLGRELNMMKDLFSELDMRKQQGWVAFNNIENVFNWISGWPTLTDCRLFEPESEVLMMMGNSRLDSASLRTDCMLFTDDGKYMVVATTAPAPDQLLTIPLAYPNNEALPVTNYSLEIYTFFTIDIEKGSIAHFVMYNFDRINLTHGVALCGPTMMVMSVQKQIIHMLHVNEEGRMIPLKDIGPSIWDDDSLFLFGDCRVTPTNASIYSGLKQRLLTFMYKEAKCSGNVDDFLRLIPPYMEKLRMHRAQLFDGHYVLVRMLPLWTEITGILRKFRRSFAHTYTEPSSISKIVSIQSALQTKGTLVHEKCYIHYGALFRIIFQHSSSENPFLDPLYFSIDEKIHSNLMYGRMRFDLGPVRIFARRTHHHVSSLNLPTALASKSTACVFLFHPQDPLAIAFDRVRTDQPLAFYLPSSPED
ncbi:unnamed protein product [Angiostrongylus costaricensis]|uniref:DUF295 domain-containing protein n=1 Tax=Angiostrongylus costaricensis TaxID=334426 RepID=A0A0R3PGD4_ANGCS|nr:unnamed protein product [Angiostrongylus costaricensis]